jgi:preprotein translocase subunit YajC
MKNKGERGSVTLFVVGVGMIVMIMLMAFMMNLESKKQAQKKKSIELLKVMSRMSKIWKEL